MRLSNGSVHEKRSGTTFPISSNSTKHLVTKESQLVPIAVSVSLPLGVVIGILIDNIPLGCGIGLMVGAIAAMAVSTATGKKSDDE